MAYRRSIIARSQLFYQQHQRFSPSLSHIGGSDREQLPAKRNPEMLSSFLISRNNVGNSRLMRSEVPAGYGLLSGNVSRRMRSEVPAGYGLVFHRNMSKVPSDIEVPADDFNGVVGVLAEKAVEAAPVANEVATAAAGSISNLNIIDFVHCYTGLEWWASIAVVALFVRLMSVPFDLRKLQRFSPKPNESCPIQSFKNAGWAEDACLFMSAIVIYASILELVEKVPSFTTGGILWFTDLTTPNYVELPILIALTCWARQELDPIQFIEAATPHKFRSVKYAKIKYALVVAVAAGFPTAVHILLITYNLTSIVYANVMIHPRVQKLLGMSFTIPRSDGK